MLNVYGSFCFGGCGQILWKFVGNVLRFCFLIDRNLQGRANLPVDNSWVYLSSGCIVVSFSSHIQGFKFHQDLIFIPTKELDPLKWNFLDWTLGSEQKHLNVIVLHYFTVEDFVKEKKLICVLFSLVKIRLKAKLIIRKQIEIDENAPLVLNI